MDQPRLLAVVAESDGRHLSVTWPDRRNERVDLRPLIESFAVLEPLSDPDAFRAARVGEGGWFVEWPEMAEDAALAADTLWRLAREQAGDAMPRDAFRDWRRRNGLSLSDAAEALGLSRRQIAYYDSGEKLIPKYIALACMGYERMRDLPKAG